MVIDSASSHGSLSGVNPVRGALVIVALALLGLACSSAPAEEPSAIRVGVLPDQSEAVLREQFQPLMEHLEASLGIPAELVVPADYDDLVSTFEAADFDIALFGGVTYLLAERRADARPLVLRDIDLVFTSDLVVSAAASGEDIEAFAGGTLAFGPELSTSGHLMPRFLFESEGLLPETLFRSVRHSSGHDETVLWVQEGVVDVGVVNSVVVEAMLASGEVSPDQVRVLSRTEPYRNYVWATASTLDDATRLGLQDAFLALDRTIPQHAAILEALGAGGFLPASRTDYDILRQVVDRRGLLDSGGPS